MLKFANLLSIIQPPLRVKVRALEKANKCILAAKFGVFFNKIYIYINIYIYIDVYMYACVTVRALENVFVVLFHRRQATQTPDITWLK